MRSEYHSPERIVALRAAAYRRLLDKSQDIDGKERIAS
jgi:hypothetical protein